MRITKAYERSVTFHPRASLRARFPFGKIRLPHTHIHTHAHALSVRACVLTNLNCQREQRNDAPPPPLPHDVVDAVLNSGNRYYTIVTLILLK